MTLLQILGCSFLIVTVFGQDRTISLTDSTTTVTWAPKTAESIVVEAEAGYQIQVDILHLDLDGENDNYVSIKTVDKNSNDASELTLTYLLSTTMSYFYNDNKISGEYVGDSPSNNFTIQFTRKGEALTTITTQSTSTTEALPTPELEEKSTITVYLYGKAAYRFDDASVKQLKETLAKMGRNYCSVQACPLNGTITVNNINIEKLQICSVLWESYDNCVSLTFGIPVNILGEYEEEPLWQNYQLSVGHLNIMWSTYGESYMNSLGLSLYPVPNIDSIFQHKLIMFSFIIIAFVIIIFIVRRVTEKNNRKRTRRGSLTLSIDASTKRISEESLNPHFLQEVPPLFTSDFPIYTDQRNYSENFGEFNESFADEYNENEYNTQKKEPITIIGDLEEICEEKA